MCNSCLWEATPNLLDYQAKLHHGFWRWVTYLIWQSVMSLPDARWGTGRWVCWPGQCTRLHLINRSPVWGRFRKERRFTITQWSLAACRCLFRMGPRYGRWAHSVNHLRWLRMVCVDIWALWHPGFTQQFLWMVFTDHLGVWGEYANPLMVWFLEVAHYVDGSR